MIERKWGKKIHVPVECVDLSAMFFQGWLFNKHNLLYHCTQTEIRVNCKRRATDTDIGCINTSVTVVTLIIKVHMAPRCVGGTRPLG